MAHILDSLRNVLDFRNKNIVDAIRDRKDIQASTDYLDYIADNEDVLLSVEKKSFVQRGISTLRRSIVRYDDNIKTNVAKFTSEIDNLALDFIKHHETTNLQAKQVTSLNTASTQYGNKIIDEVNHDWGQSRILSKIDRSLAQENKTEKRTPEYIEARNDLNNSLHLREAKIILAANNIQDVEKELNKLKLAINVEQSKPVEKKITVEPEKTYIVTSSKIKSAFIQQYEVLKKDYDANKNKLNLLNNPAVATMEAKNTLTKGVYKTLHADKKKTSSEEYLNITEKIQKIDNYFKLPENARILETTIVNVKNKFTKMASEIELKQVGLSAALKDIRSEIDKLANIPEKKLKINTLKLSMLKADKSYQRQLGQIPRKQITNSL